MMNSIAPCLLALTIIGLSSSVRPAWANPDLDAVTAMSMTDALQPASRDANHLNHLAENIQHQMSTTDTALPLAIDFQQIPLLGNFLDQDGNLDLPLGLTIYNTMGDTSVGFGTTF